MAANIPEALQKKMSTRLSFYEDLGIPLFYLHRGLGPRTVPGPSAETQEIPSNTRALSEESALSKRPSTKLLPNIPAAAISAAPKTTFLPSAPKPSLFEAMDRIADDSLLRIRNDLGECTRCKLHRGRNKIVFGEGNPKAQLVFVGEGPGHDEDVQGLPFVGRAGKLLTQMIEAMGLERKDVYICNVVKCRPPENRTPEKDEITTCSPFLLRQLDAINAKVIVCLGSVAAQTLLETNRGISHYRGEWLDFRGRKLLATYHPAYLLRNPGAKSEVWKDLQKVMAVLGLQPRKGRSS